MTGKDFKKVAALIPDGASVDLATCERNEGSFTPSELITGATVMTTIKFSNNPFLKDKVETTIIFDIEGGENCGCNNK
jgi:uncharacterized lipoprotein YehR (DUF1307 family)